MPKDINSYSVQVLRDAQGDRTVVVTYTVESEGVQQIKGVTIAWADLTNGQRTKAADILTVFRSRVRAEEGL